MNTENASPKIRTILVVEDERPIRKLIATILKRSGYAVLEASDPEEAALIWAKNSASIDLLFTDVILPSLSGPELAREFISIRPDLKIIFATGGNGAIIDETVNLVESKQFLQKPFTSEQLLSAVDAAFKPVS